MLKNFYSVKSICEFSFFEKEKNFTNSQETCRSDIFENLISLIIVIVSETK